VAGLPLKGAQLGFRCNPIAICSACGFLHPTVGWRSVGRIRPTGEAVTRFPFVSKADVLRAYRPGEDASNRTFRTLRERGWVSGGLAIRQHRNGRVAGQLRCYSALNIDAVILARHDHRDDAIEAAEEARNFEAEWEPTVKALAVELNLADFDAFRTARNELAQSLAPASEQLERLHTRLLEIVGTSVREEFVRIGAMTS
jgi:hypothetical protein